MNKTRFLHGKERLARVLVIGGVLGLFGFAQSQSPSPRSLVPPESPGVPPIGLEFFRLQPTVSDTTFRLLVIPVQFPEDGVLGGGSPEQILDKLNGSDPLDLAGYYVHETASRLHIVSTLAPIVTAPHSRAYYTTEGGAFGSNGLDPGSYPHNGQGLVDDVTRVLDDRIDFRLYDNTQDGIVDGLLILHSGPESAETSAGALPADVLVAHAFTLPTPEPRGGSTVFPYALAATRDGIGVWAHEVGHLFGLPDLYVANSVCFGPGLGEWSLMATGANRGGGDNPTGLDAFSLQLLGMTPRFDDGSGVALSQGVFLRASDPGQESGPRYYLVDFREAGDGAAGSTPARVVYLVNDDAVDNRSCSNPPESYRPLVRVAGIVCPGDTTCSQSYYQTCALCPNVGFMFSGTTVHVQSGALPPIVLSRVQIGTPFIGINVSEEQKVRLSFRNVDTDAAHTVSITTTAMDPDSVCISGTIPNLTIEPGTTEIDSSLTLVRCIGLGFLPRRDLKVAMRISDNIWSRTDTLILPASRIGLDYHSFTCEYQTDSSNTAWRAIGLKRGAPCPPACCPIGYDAWFGSLSHGELLSPWFSIPKDGQVSLTHEWDFAALSPDVALDAGQVRLRRLVGADVLLAPPGGWGYTIERGVGNILGGQVGLSGSGQRFNVLDLSQFSGDVARLVLVASGDVEVSNGTWSVRDVEARSAPPISFSLEEAPGSPGTLVTATSASYVPKIGFILFRGISGIAPTKAVFSGRWNGEARMALGHFEGSASRFELVWIDSTGAAASVGAIFNLPVTPAPHFLLAPSPNPVHGGHGQNWAIRVPDDAPPGTYTVRLLSLDGGVLLEQSVRIDQPGARLIPWDGLDGEGRTISNGIYFLEARRPDGVQDGQRIVVLP